VVLPGQDHFFLEFEGRRLEKHRPGEMTVANELLAALDAELRRRGLLGKACVQAEAAAWPFSSPAGSDSGS
jgi:hypothetical protein